MGLIYIPVGSGEIARALSRGLVALSRPPGHRPPGTMTDYFGHRVHPQSGAVVVEIEADLPVHIHAEADPTDLLGIIAADATEAELQALQALVDGLKAEGGGTVPLGTLVPSALAQQAMTHEHLAAAGWFAEIGAVHETEAGEA